MKTTSLTYALLINSAGFSQQSPQTALHFARAVLAQGHQIVRIFFYQDGVLNANEWLITPKDESDLLQQWQQLARDISIPLVLCSTAAIQRGILNKEEAQRYEKSGHNLAEGFVLGGLGQLMDAIIQADRVVSFGY